MRTITAKLPGEMADWLERTARDQNRPKSEIVRDALEKVRAEKQGGSALDLAGDAVGRVESGARDLGSDRRHLKGFGR